MREEVEMAEEKEAVRAAAEVVAKVEAAKAEAAKVEVRGG